jgi:hypothetical protein
MQVSKRACLEERTALPTVQLELNGAAADPTGSGHTARRFLRPSSIDPQVPCSLRTKSPIEP